MTCEHRRRHLCRAEVLYLADTHVFRAELKIWCADCGVPMRFKGVVPGLHPNIPTSSVAGEELRLAIEPMDIDGPLPPERAGLILPPEHRHAEG